MRRWEREGKKKIGDKEREEETEKLDKQVAY